MEGEDEVDDAGRRGQTAGRAARSGERARPPAKGGGGGSPRTPAGGADRVRVTDRALAKIVGLSAHEVPGVVGMAPASLGEGIRRILGARQVDEGVVVTRHEDPSSADVDIHVVVAYGVNIPAVADSIRERVRYAAGTYAGVELGAVRVHVAGVSRA
ncbi:MAG TPA: Asp23/Gls24 family envelope stress response protein [Trueperaceae bacterium]